MKKLKAPGLRARGELKTSARVTAGLAKAIEGIEAEAENTTKAHGAAKKTWEGFCSSEGIDPSFPTTVAILASYLGTLFNEGAALNTVKARRSWISKMHRDFDDNPAKDWKITKMIAGWAREAQPTRRAAAFSPSMIRAAWDDLAKDGDALTMYRSLVTVGLVTGMRVSELVSIRWVDIKGHPKGRVIVIPKSKTDQAGRGQVVVLPRNEKKRDYCPVHWLEQWRQDGGGKGRVFPVSRQSVHKLAKRIARLSGEDERRYSSHSFRAGLMTTATRADVPLATTMQQSRHRSYQIAADYVRLEGDMDNAAAVAVVDALGDDEA